MSYVTGRDDRAALPIHMAAAEAKPVGDTTASGGVPSFQPGTPLAPVTNLGTAPRTAPQEDEEAVLLPPPQPPVVLPSSAAAVRVKEQMLRPPLAVGGGYLPAEGADGDDAYQGMGAEGEGSEAVDASSDAASLEQGQAGEPAPGLLSRTAEVAGTVAASVTNAASAAVGAAAPVVRSVVGQGAVLAASGFEAAKEKAEAVAAAVQKDEDEEQPGPAAAGEDLTTERGLEPGGMVPGQRPVLPSPFSPQAGEPHASAAATTAAVLPASSASPVATGKGYFPTVGAAVAVPKPAPRPSGELALLAQPAGAGTWGIPVMRLLILMKGLSCPLLCRCKLTHLLVSGGLSDPSLF